MRFTKRLLVSEKEMNAFIHSKIGLASPKELSSPLLGMVIQKEDVVGVTKATLERTRCN